MIDNLMQSNKNLSNFYIYSCFIILKNNESFLYFNFALVESMLNKTKRKKNKAHPK